ncbi:hypothetical protein [Sulfobacillus harzensis]|uniref:Uncharacterized protein n=1 Tax=Sulfobacillus harzensis TaxID=2729629 RepID=A0A7Y0L338_9FIRM|nr:hypothetical protein [Sulfobacillus harzensis]NMP22198.1 hypothetical protein [Sulfobacillus harzensis]
MELSKFGRDYGASLCLAPGREFTPLSDLTPEERACVERVGGAVEQKVLEDFGVNADPPQLARYRVTGRHGQDLGTLTYAEGVLNWCVPKDAPPQCGTVGHGQDGLAATLKMLRLLGFSTQSLS